MSGGHANLPTLATECSSRTVNRFVYRMGRVETGRLFETCVRGLPIYHRGQADRTLLCQQSPLNRDIAGNIGISRLEHTGTVSETIVATAGYEHSPDMTEQGVCIPNCAFKISAPASKHRISDTQAGHRSFHWPIWQPMRHFLNRNVSLTLALEPPPSR